VTRNDGSAEDRIRLGHLVDALNSAIRFARGRSRRDLDADEMLLFALTRAIEIAGEAASRVSAETKDALPDLPWNAIVGMRNRLVHAYFDIDHDILWTTVTAAAPQLVERLRLLLASWPMNPP
jgi:uncharacterized protein with HEPN domain